MEFFSIMSRVASDASEGAGEGGFGTRLQAALLRRASEEFGPRWRGPFEQEESGPAQRPPSASFYDDVARGLHRVTFVAATRCDGASQAVRAALYRNSEPGADFPPVLMTPDAETVRSGALHLALRQLAERAIPLYAIDLLDVSGSAMPEALRIVTEAIAREGRASRPARWIALVDPLYEARIGRWSAPEFFGEVRIKRSQPIDGISLGVRLEAGSLTLRIEVLGILASLYLGVTGYERFRGGADWIGRDVARVQRVLDASVASLSDGGLVEIERSVRMNPHVERLTQLVMAHRAGALRSDGFVDRTLDALAQLRREEPGEAAPVAEFIAAYADSHPIDPVPVPDGAGFVETIGPAPVVQRVRRREREPEGG